MGGSSQGVTISYTEGTFQSCSCMARWWPVLLAVCKRRGEPAPRVTQGSYRPVTSYSAATHCGGGVIDLTTTGDWAALDTLMETMGAAAYERTPADGFTRHSHVILTGCPHLDPSAQRQIASWMDRRNGLVSNTLDRDQTRPPTWRTYAEGIEWARKLLTVQTYTPPRTSPEEDDMPDLSQMRVPNPYGDREGTRRADYAVAEGARYGFLALGAVNKLAKAFAAFVSAEKGSDSELSKLVQSAADGIAADVADLDADVADLSAHLGNDGSVA